MAVLTGLSGPIIVLTDNPAISVQLSEYEADYWPPFAVETTVLDLTTLQRNDPVDVITFPLPSNIRGPSFADDFYNRIHVTPNPINVGNLLAEDTRFITVWNAFFDQKQLLSVINETDTSGITLTGPFPEPTEFQELEDRIYTLTVSLNGSPLIDATFSVSIQLKKRKKYLTRFFRIFSNFDSICTTSLMAS